MAVVAEDYDTSSMDGEETVVFLGSRWASWLIIQAFLFMNLPVEVTCTAQFMSYSVVRLHEEYYSTKLCHLVNMARVEPYWRAYAILEQGFCSISNRTQAKRV